MPVHAASHVVSSPVLSPKSGSRSGKRLSSTHTRPVRVSMQASSLPGAGFCRIGPGLQFQIVDAIRSVSSARRQSSSLICPAALQATCRASGQTQTITREAPTITRAPTHSKEKLPQLYDGGTGFPPRNDGGGGGGGGGGGFNSSGGFYLFGFLLFMSYLKDLEGEHDQDGSRM